MAGQTEHTRLGRDVLTSGQIDAALDDGGDLFLHVNRVLYELCAAHPRHTDKAEVIGKVFLIGRTYAAAIERRRDTKGVNNDRFYTDYVAEALIHSSVDADLDALNRERSVTDRNLPSVLSAHDRLVRVLARLTKLKKRSLASKYLHFHRPALFFIKDSRAWQSLRRLTPRIPVPAGLRGLDRDYTPFCLRMVWLRDEVRTAFGRSLTPRQLDRLLLGMANQRPTDRLYRRKGDG